MTSLQKRQLQSLEDLVSAMVAELSPRVILPTVDKQEELGIAEETMLIPVAKRRAITLNANADGSWAVKEFDTSSGALIPLWEQDKAVSGEVIIEVVLAAAVKSLAEQLGATDAVAADERPQLAHILRLLQARHATLLADGLESFEFEPILDVAEPELVKN